MYSDSMAANDYFAATSAKKRCRGQNISPPRTKVLYVDLLFSDDDFIYIRLSLDAVCPSIAETDQKMKLRMAISRIAARPITRVFSVCVLYPFSGVIPPKLVTTQKKESFAWETVIAPAPMAMQTSVT